MDFSGFFRWFPPHRYPFVGFELTWIGCVSGVWVIRAMMGEQKKSKLVFFCHTVGNITSNPTIWGLLSRAFDVPGALKVTVLLDRLAVSHLTILHLAAGWCGCRAPSSKLGLGC